MRAVAGAGHVVGGRYRLQDEIGRGAMGAVWQARDELLDRDVAVKELVVSPGLGTADRDSLYQRTLREAKTAARLSHPGVVTVYDVVEEDGRPWIIMELVRARSLEQVLAQDGPLPAAQAAGIGQQLIGALAAAHQAGVLHRDVKPSNVLLTPDGRAVLTDFGIATLEGDSQLTQTGMVMGTPAFTAPERIRGEPATPASDFWSLGATLYAAVQGRGPYQERGGPMTTMTAVIHEDVPAAPAAGPLAPVIAALMNRDPAARPDAAAAARMLTAARATRSSWPSRRPQVAEASWAPAQPQAAAASWVPGQPPATDALPAIEVPMPPAPAASGAANGRCAAPSPAGQSWPTSAPATANSPQTVGAAWRAGEPGAAQQAWNQPSGGMPYGAPVAETGAAATRVAGPYPAGRTAISVADRAAPSAASPTASPEPGTRRAAVPGRVRTRAARRRGRGMFAAGAAVTIVAGVLGGLAIAHFTGSVATKSGHAGSGAGHGQPGAGHAARPAAANTPASPTPQALPTGYSWYARSAASAGTAAGFRMAVPADWKTAQSGLVSYARNPSGAGFLEVDLTQHTKAGNLAQARWLQLRSLRQHRFPGYRPISLRPASILGSAGAVWTFSWTERGVGRVIARDYMFSAAAGGSAQSYAVYGSAPAPAWPRTAEALAEAIRSFQPIS